MADVCINGGCDNRTVKKGTKTKLTKLFRRKKNYNKFDSEVNFSTNYGTKTNGTNSVRSVEDKLDKLKERKKGQRQSNEAKQETMNSDNKKYSGLVHSGSSEMKMTTLKTEMSTNRADFELIDIQGHNDIDDNLTSSCDIQRAVTQMYPTENTKMDEIKTLGENMTEPAGLNKDNNKGEVKYHKHKGHKSKRLEKLKRKLHFSNYKELYESSDTINVMKKSRDTNKKKSLQRAGKHVRKAFRSGLRSLVEGIQYMSPLTAGVSPPCSAYHTEDGKNYNPYYTRTRPNIVPFFV